MKPGHLPHDRHYPSSAYRRRLEDRDGEKGECQAWQGYGSRRYLIHVGRRRRGMKWWRDNETMKQENKANE